MYLDAENVRHTVHPTTPAGQMRRFKILELRAVMLRKLCVFS